MFKTQIIYPELACREALINAITHRDYSIEGRGIEIKIFDDRLEILSPGKLLSSLTIEDLEELKGVHQTRNTYVGRALREFGYIRELGEGIRRMFDLMKSNELIPPKIESPNKSFIVSLFHEFIYTKEEKLWLDNFERFELTREQKTVVTLGIDGRLISPKQIFDNVGIVDTEEYRQIIQSLQESGILISEVPKSKAQTIARKGNISVKDIPRFKIQIPNSKVSAPKIDKAKKLETDKFDYAKIYVSNLDYSVKERDLINFFSNYGNVSDAYIPKDHFTKKSRGFGFVEFETNESIRKLLADSTPKFILNRRIYIQEYKTY